MSNKIKIAFPLAVMIALALFIGVQSGAAESKVKVDPKPVNPLCPITGGAVKEDGGKLVWNTTTISFCCPDCIDKFEKMTAKEKATKLHKAMAKVEPVNSLCPSMKKGKVKAKGGSTVWKGKKIGFCCPGCLKKWDKKTDKDKDAFVAKYVKPSKS